VAALTLRGVVLIQTSSSTHTINPVRDAMCVHSSSSYRPPPRTSCTPSPLCTDSGRGLLLSNTPIFSQVINHHLLSFPARVCLSTQLVHHDTPSHSTRTICSCRIHRFGTSWRMDHHLHCRRSHSLLVLSSHPTLRATGNKRHYRSRGLCPCRCWGKTTKFLSVPEDTIC